MDDQDALFVQAGKKSDDEGNNSEVQEDYDSKGESKAAAKKICKHETTEREQDVVDAQAEVDKSFASYLKNQTKTTEQIASKIRINEIKARTEKENANTQRRMLELMF